MSATLQEQLSSLPIPRLTTVLRVNFALIEGRTSFTRACELIETWWDRKALAYGKTLKNLNDLEFQQAGFVVDFARAQDEFVLAMEEPDSTLERVWLCDFAVRRIADRSQFSVRLSYRQPHSLLQRPEPRAPKFLQELVDIVGAVDVRAMETIARPISINDLPFLTDLIKAPSRTLPVIVISEESFTAKVFTDPDKLAKTLAGTAHVFRVDPAAAWQLSEEWNREISTFQGAIRCYSPGFSLEDDKFKHRLWLPLTIQRLDANTRQGFLNACAGHVFTQVTALFEPQVLLTPASVRRRTANKLSLSIKSDFTTSTQPQLPSAKLITSPKAPSLVRDQIILDYEDKLAALLASNRALSDQLDRLQAQTKSLEDARDQERAGRAEADARSEDKEGYLKLYEAELDDLRRERDLALGDVSGETSEALRPLWSSFTGFFDSLQNVAIKFRRMEADSDRNAELTRDLHDATINALTLQSKLDSLDQRRVKDTGEEKDLTRFRVTELLPQLAQKNPALTTSLHMVATLFPDRVVVLDSAAASASSSAVFKHGERALDLLCTLATDYWEVIQASGDTEARKLFGNAYAPSESSKLSKAGTMRRTFMYRDTPIVMEKHLKIGVADNAADTLRIHFEWLAEDKKLIIGHCGSHLDF